MKTTGHNNASIPPKDMAGRENFEDLKINFGDIVKFNVAGLETCAFIVLDIKKKSDIVWFLVPFLFYVIGVYGSQLASEIINLRFLTGSIAEITAASFLFLTHAIQIPKVLLLYVNMPRVKALIRSINRPEFQPKSEKQKKTLKTFIMISKVLSISFWGACVATCTFWALSPFTEEELSLPLAGWFPFNTNVSPNFEYAYIYQFIAATLNGLSNISIDTLMSGLIMVICAQLYILNDSIANIRHFSELELGHEVGSSFPSNDNDLNEISPLLQETMDRKLVECIVHHRCILGFAAEFQLLFTYSILGQFVASVIIICITMFQLTLTPVGSLQFFSMVLYQYCMLLEIYLWCYFGNEVILQSTELTKSAYTFDWIGCSKKFRHILLYFMTNSQVELKIYAGGFFTLSLGTFMNILRSSWSYFAVLMNVNK